MKFCPKCGNQLQEGSKFCGNCGLNIEAAKANMQQEPQQEVAKEAPVYEYNYKQEPQQAKKKKKSTIIVIVVVIVVFLAAVIVGGSFVAKSLLSSNIDEFEEIEDRDASELDVPEFEVPELDDILEGAYDDGDVENGVYINEWANLKFTVSDKFPEASDSVYDQYDNETTDCGFASANLDTAQQFVLLYEYVDPNLGLDEEDYLNLAVKRTETEMAASDLSYAVDTYFDYTIAGQTYRVAKITVNGVVTEYICARQQGDRIIAMLLTSQYESDITGMLDSMTTVH